MRSKINAAALFAKVEGYYKSLANYNPNTQVISKSALVMSALITTGTTNQNFNVNANSGVAALAWEVRLQTTDTFAFSRLGMFGYGVQGSATGPATILANKYWTYAPTQLSSTFLNVQGIWDSGALNMLLNGRQFVKNWLSNQHYQAPRTQDEPYQAITTSGTPNSATIACQTLGEDGVADVEPFVTLSGSWTNTISMIYPAPGITPVTNFAFVGDANDIYFNINYVNIYLEGLLIQNSSSILGSGFIM